MSSRKRPVRYALLLALAGATATGFIAPRAHADAPAQAALKSTAQQREEVGITIYNQNFGLVREVRTIDLPTGRSFLEFRDVSERIQTETVSIKSLTPGAGQLRVLEQNYRYDLLSPQKLLEKYVGKKVKVYRWNEKTGKDDEFEAEVLSAGQGTVLRINGEITYDFPGRIAFPQIPENLISKPTLVWMLEGGGKQKIEVTYLTQNLNWNADYVFTINENDTAGDITGWVTLNNTTGTAYDNAKLKLVAGDVQRVQQAQMGYGGAMKSAPSASVPRRPQFQEEGFFEYHLYTLERPTTLLNAEQKQVTLLEAQGVKVDKRLIFYGAANYFRGQYGQVVSNQKVGVYLDVENKETNHMGMPLPKGVVRVYKADKSGAKQFIGEDNIDHTPRDEKVRIKMGEAFDVVGDRKQTDYKILGSGTTESAWEISLRNHKDTPTAVEVYEPVGGDWEMVSSSIPQAKKDPHTFTFMPTIAARGEVKITYRVRVKWC
ncbi:DUF4139 domain-containing protein [soil metagenome]